MFIFSLKNIKLKWSNKFNYREMKENDKIYFKYLIFYFDFDHSNFKVLDGFESLRLNCYAFIYFINT